MKPVGEGTDGKTVRGLFGAGKDRGRRRRGRQRVVPALDRRLGVRAQGHGPVVPVGRKDPQRRAGLPIRPVGERQGVEGAAGAHEEVNERVGRWAVLVRRLHEGVKILGRRNALRQACGRVGGRQPLERIVSPGPQGDAPRIIRPQGPDFARMRGRRAGQLGQPCVNEGDGDLRRRRARPGKEGLPRGGIHLLGFGTFFEQPGVEDFGLRHD